MIYEVIFGGRADARGQVRVGEDLVDGVSISSIFGVSRDEC
jgi:hypothetical protein